MPPAAHVRDVTLDGSSKVLFADALTADPVTGAPLDFGRDRIVILDAKTHRVVARCEPVRESRRRVRDRSKAGRDAAARRRAAASVAPGDPAPVVPTFIAAAPAFPGAEIASANPESPAAQLPPVVSTAGPEPPHSHTDLTRGAACQFVATDYVPTAAQLALRVGDAVAYLNDSGVRTAHRVRFAMPYKAADDTWVVHLEGIVGFVALQRVVPLADFVGPMPGDDDEAEGVTPDRVPVADPSPPAAPEPRVKRKYTRRSPAIAAEPAAVVAAPVAVSAPPVVAPVPEPVTPPRPSAARAQPLPTGSTPAAPPKPLTEGQGALLMQLWGENPTFRPQQVINLFADRTGRRITPDQAQFYKESQEL